MESTKNMACEGVVAVMRLGEQREKDDALTEEAHSRRCLVKLDEDVPCFFMFLVCWPLLTPAKSRYVCMHQDLPPE